MSGEHNWRIEENALDYFGNQRKQLSMADRRPVIRTAADLVGPGINQHCVRIADFNSEIATVNGWFSAAPGTPNAPEATRAYVGHVVSDTEFGGYQSFTSLAPTPTGRFEYKRTFLRSAVDPNTIYWDSWRVTYMPS